jgi:hypothetical protein
MKHSEPAPTEVLKEKGVFSLEFSLLHLINRANLTTKSVAGCVIMLFYIKDWAYRA